MTLIEMAFLMGFVFGMGVCACVLALAQFMAIALSSSGDARNKK